MASTTSIARDGAWKLLAIIAVVAVLGATMVLGVRPIAGFFKSHLPATKGSAATVSAVDGKPVAPRDRLGVNVVGVTYYGGEPVYANQLFGLRWLVPSAGWGVDTRRRP